MSKSRSEAILRQANPRIMGNRYMKGTRITRIKDGLTFFVEEDSGGPLRLREHPGKLFDRSFFKAAK